MNALKAMAGDSVQSSEFWLLPPVLGLIVDGGLSDVQCGAVAVCYVAFVLARGIAKKAAPVVPLLLAAVLLVGCSTMAEWWNTPLDAQPPTPVEPLVVEGELGTVTVTPPAAEPPVTNGDAAADGIGAIVTALTGVGLFGLLASKGIKIAGARAAAKVQS